MSGAEAEPAPNLSGLPAPFDAPTHEAIQRPRRLGLIIAAASAAAVIIGTVFAVVAFAPFSSTTVTAEQSAPAPTSSIAPEPQAVTPDSNETATGPTTKSTPTLDVPGSGAAPIPEGATKLCVYGTTKEVEFYLYQNPLAPDSDDLLYVGGNTDLGYLELPATAVYFAGGGVSGHRMSNSDGTEYYLTGHELTVTPSNGEGFYQIVHEWQQFGC